MIIKHKAGHVIYDEAYATAYVSAYFTMVNHNHNVMYMYGKRNDLNAATAKE